MQRRSEYSSVVETGLSLSEIASFVAVVEHGTITAAARAEGVPKSTVSRRIARLEEALGVQLLVRSSRSFAITAEGKRLHAQAKPALQSLNEIQSSFQERVSEPSGLLVLTAPHDIARAWFFVDVLARYRQRYPAVHIEARLESRYVDLVAEGVDVAIRGHGSHIPGDPTLKVKTLGGVKMGLFAGDGYLEQRGVPASLADLAKHDLVAHQRFGDGLFGQGDGADTVSFRDASLVVNDMWLLHTLAASDMGIAMLPVADAERCRPKKLVRVLPEWSSIAGRLSIVWPQTQYLATRVQAFIELASTTLSSHLQAPSAGDTTP